ncbi:VACUOLAR ATP SYNTHASE SUBUNIT AC39 [Encephalitozoon cuniculi GB-M1]|uniref:V-type proton ATPase subunit n=2 Tax=Encephalitozoon cuniculi TaxID=6035 RepID=Q8SR97_ENCCU|nr:H(+)-transporting V0 sector ATPase subunit d [Encephalitozoon cuniculi GB-M1]KMV65679.1 vacuolar-type H+-ATPase [Encephalitozoon cuniculi EcunIII-L]UYI27084.1 v-type proton ATPase subunit d [Encephalitozoon cuniculi]CAD26456.2 VACUOLAR ATP SYNTHASE SUBUNIT AC39 [Encephalitozoon cuniculi GB-M1]
MEKQFSHVERYGYIISEINGKKEEMLKEEDYNALKRCENLEEVAIKLSKTYRSLSEGIAYTKPELKKRLLETLKADFDHYRDVEDKGIRTILDYYMDFHKIQNFFYLLQCKLQDPNLGRSFEKIEIGDFSALRTIKFSNNMDDVQRYCMENSFLKKFEERVRFKKEFSANNFQVLQTLFFKFHIEETYRNLNDDMEHMREILRLEGDRQIIEIAMNTLNSKDLVGRKRMSLFPDVHSMDLRTRELLSHVEGLEDMKSVLSTRYNFDKDISNVLIRAELQKYQESFSMYGDLSCVYSYFKIKEQEIKNILWVAECIIQNRRDAMDHLFVV